MFKIIGADQKEYGPVSADELRQWIAEGRANGQTLVQVEGGAWQPLSAIPGFAPQLPQAPAPLAASTPPPFTAGADASSARQQVSGPAIGLMVTGVLGGLGSLLGLLWNLLGLGAGFAGADLRGNPELEHLVTLLTGTLGTIVQLLILGVSCFIFYGGLKLRNLESYPLCVVAVILAILTIACCSCPSCCIGPPAGIWALVVLNRPEVKSQFR
jgi:hypothetical protein